MGNLQRDVEKLNAADLPDAPSRGVLASALRVWRLARSITFLLAYVVYLVLFVGLIQRLLLIPTIWLLPRRRDALVGAWLRLNARATLALARILATVRVRVQGVVRSESCIIVMTHQSVLDIPIGLSLVRGPYPLIPTRDRYGRGIPGVSPLIRLARFPLISQGAALTRPELRALIAAADRVARGEQSLLIFPEGHRSRDGAIGPFMRSGLRLMLRRARRPVYCVVADGLTHSRGFADALTRIADTQVRVVVLGPFDPPDADSIDSFIDGLHTQMTATLAALRATPGERGAAPSSSSGTSAAGGFAADPLDNTLDVR